MKVIHHISITLLIGLFGTNILQAQTINFLRISPDTRSAAMGDVGTGTSPDANAVFWNTARNAFNENSLEVAVNYMPWLQELDSDIRLKALGLYVRLSERHSLSYGLRHFSLGKLDLFDETAVYQGSATPYEFGTEIGYAYRVSPNFSLSVTPKYVSTSLSSLTTTPGEKMSVVTVDLGTYLRHEIGEAIGMNYGLVVAQAGSITATETLQLPAVLRGGLSLDYTLDQASTLVIASDISKNFHSDANKENLSISHTVGLGTEYSFKDILALRLGYSTQKYGDRSLNNITTGVMLGYQGWQFGFAYLIPASDNHALNNTMRFSVTYAMTKKK